MRRYWIWMAAAAALLYSCASPGTPSGGPRDEVPPRFVSASPAPGSVNVDKQKAVITFDEIVNVKDAFSKVVISPTSSQTPRVSSLGRKITIEFQDTLASNTTYTVDFGNAIEDNNEGNKLQGFSYTFSTGPEIDTLQISGMVLAARNLEPQQGMLVGVHREVSDTTFATTRLERVAKTDDRGRFTIRGLAPGDYHVFALKDLNNDYRWDNPEEDIAFYGSVVRPYSETATAKDTIWNMKTGVVDSVIMRERTRFLPNDVLLNSFNIEKRPQYLVKYDRPDSIRLTMLFNAKQEAAPEVSVVGEQPATPWYRLERSATNDTLTYWLTDKSLIRNDSLLIATRYAKGKEGLEGDSVTWQNDTLRFFLKKLKPKKENKKKKGEEATDSVPKVELYKMTIIASGTQDVYNPVRIEFAEPVDTVYADKFHLEEKADTLWQRARHDFTLSPPDSLTGRRISLEYPWEFGKEYKLTVDSIAAESIYGLHTGPASQSIKVKKEEEYSTLRLRITGLPDSVGAFVELLNKSDVPVRTARVNHGLAEMKYLTPNTYYLRLVEDRNDNGLYDTGDYDSGLQPELAYYYPKSLKLRANWEVEQDWDVNAVALDAQKPMVLKKNKPESGKHKKATKEEEEEEEEEEMGVGVGAAPRRSK